MDNEDELANSAKALAKFHRSALDYKPSSTQKETIAQYKALGFSNEVSCQIDDPNLQIINMMKIKEIVGSDSDQELIRQMYCQNKKIDTKLRQF